MDCFYLCANASIEYNGVQNAVQNLPQAEWEIVIAESVGHNTQVSETTTTETVTSSSWNTVTTRKYYQNDLLHAKYDIKVYPGGELVLPENVVLSGTYLDLRGILTGVNHLVVIDLSVNIPTTEDVICFLIKVKKTENVKELFSDLFLDTCTALRSELVPITEPDFIESRVEPSGEINTSLTVSRLGMQASIKLSSNSEGTSFRLCTAKSTSFCATALSISFSKIPF